MISSTNIWEEFFDRYIKDVLIKDTEYGTVGRVDVSKTLLVFFESRLYEDLVNNPVPVINHARQAFKWVINRYYPSSNGRDVEVRFYNLPIKRRVKDLRSRLLAKFVEVEGIVTKVTNVFPRVTKAIYQCTNCSNLIEVDVDGDNIPKPTQCKCGRRKFDLVDYNSVDSQIISVQDYPEKLKGGEKPRVVNVILDRDLVDEVVPGDRVRLTGIVKAGVRGGRKNAYLDVCIEANCVDVMHKEYEEFTFTEEDVLEIKRLSKDPELVRKIVSSIASTIHGYDDIKLAVILALFGGVPRTFPDGTRRRGDIHILLLGDPSTAKSQILMSVANIAPRRIIASGKGASTAGLTAAVVNDEATGRWTVEAGALVLADKGVALIDELDKMSKQDRESIHTALEQQIIPISKAGINVTLMSRCTLIAAANPKYTRFDPYVPIADQIDFDPALLSRFDLIFMVRDEPDADKDAAIADFILESYMSPSSSTPAIDPELLRKYIAYAKKNISPTISKEAAERIKEFYVKMRKHRSGSPVPITPRQLEAVIRLSEASARLHLRETVTVEDVEMAISLVEKSLLDVAYDVQEQTIDIDNVYGTPKSKRDKIMTIVKLLEQLSTGVYGASEEDIIGAAADRGISASDVKEILRIMREKGDVYCPRYGYYKLTDRV
ncbi:AAA family ATPase [Archaeoglobales archaeon]|jgi:replicative DNA helicase Mcm|nr:MAG: AAA family ATPase [Archaeoglobales archaeon]